LFIKSPVGIVGDLEVAERGSGNEHVPWPMRSWCCTRSRLPTKNITSAWGPMQPHVLRSMTKSFCGLLATMLMKEGKLDANAKIAQYLPKLASSAWGDATLQQTLDMTTGLRYDEVFTGSEVRRVPLLDGDRSRTAAGRLCRPACAA
jgi:hypothetical protein